MKACENHNETIVIYNGEICPLCKAHQKFNAITEDLKKSMEIMRQIQISAEETKGNTP